MFVIAADALRLLEALQFRGQSLVLLGVLARLAGLRQGLVARVADVRVEVVALRIVPSVGVQVGRSLGAIGRRQFLVRRGRLARRLLPVILRAVVRRFDGLGALSAAETDSDDRHERFP